MSKTLEEKHQIVDIILNKMNNNKTCLFIKQDRIIGRESVDFRKTLVPHSVEIFCVKNSLLERVLKAKDITIEGLKGSMLMITGEQDLEILNAVNKLTRQIIGLEIDFAIIDQKLIKKDITKQLCRYANRNQLLSAMAGNLILPIFKFKSLLEQIVAQKEAN